MKNELISLAASSMNSGEYEPAGTAHGHKPRQLVKATEGGYHTKHDNQGFSWRRDLNGLVHRCGGMPVIELDDGGLYAVRNADQWLLDIWSK